MTYLDTHIVEIVASQKFRQLTSDAQHVLRRETDLRVSPMVLLELEYLHEIGRTRDRALDALAKLKSKFDLRICDLPFEQVALQATHESWTRDPFDRMIVAQARLAKAVLISRDSHILANYNKAIG